jgi:class 3 adenylate cyclase
METKQVALVIVDISGYTRFIRSKKMSAIHAEEIIFELLEAVIDRAEHPLTLNKLEGDAVFLYAEMTDATQSEIVSDVMKQTREFFTVFYERAHALSTERMDCDCDACQGIFNLRLKAVLHLGEAVFRSIRQFEELAGEDVILVHQLLKNSIPSKEYILMTEAFYQRTGNLSSFPSEMREETYDTFEKINIHVHYPRPERINSNPIR